MALLRNEGIALRSLERTREALALFDRTLATSRRMYGDDHLQTAAALADIGGTLMAVERFDEARPRLATAFEVLLDKLGADHPRTVAAAKSLVTLAEKAGDEEAAPGIGNTLASSPRIACTGEAIRRHPMNRLRQAIDQCFDLFLGKFPQLYDTSVGPEMRWHHTQGLIATVHVDDQPAGMRSIFAAEVSLGDEVCSIFENGIQRPHTTLSLGTVMDLDHEPGHALTSRSDVLTYRTLITQYTLPAAPMGIPPGNALLQKDDLLGRHVLSRA